MRILFASNGLPPERRAGVELYADGLARELSRRGHAVAVVVRGRDGVGLRSEARDGYDVFTIDQPGKKRRFLDLYADERLDEAFLEILRRFEPDVFHAQHLSGLSVSHLDAAAAAGAAVVLTLHDFWLGCPRGQRVRDDRGYCAEVDRDLCARCLEPEWQGIHRDPALPLRLVSNLVSNPARKILGEYDRLVRGALERAALVLTPSEFYRDEYVRWYGLEKSRVRAVAPGLPHAVARRARPERRDGEPFTVGYVGSLIPTKGVHVLAEAVAGIELDGFRLEIHGGALPFFGRPGAAYESEIRAIAVRSRNPIRLRGRYAPEALGSILASFDALALPSIYPESYSLTLREGWLAGVPIVASRLGALAESVRDGETGLLVPPGDPAAWRAAIERLAGDAPLSRRLADVHPAITTMRAHAAEMEALYAGLPKPVRGRG